MALLAVFLGYTGYATTIYDHYLDHRWLFLLPAAMAGCLLAARFASDRDRVWSAWFLSGASILFWTGFTFAGQYPTLLPSSLSLEYSLSIHNAAASPKTLRIMLGVTLVFLPLIACYQAWVHRLFSGREGEGVSSPVPRIRR